MICLILRTQYENVDVIVSGWGTTSSGYGGSQSSTLLDATVRKFFYM